MHMYVRSNVEARYRTQRSINDLAMEPAMQSPDVITAVKGELDRILSSRAFSGADRATALLRYVVDKALSGESDQLKEYNLAVEVLGRKPSFDPRTDPIVRVEAGRLRARLEEYYQSEGNRDALLITMPKGAYVPLFERRQRQWYAWVLARLWRWRWLTWVIGSGT